MADKDKTPTTQQENRLTRREWAERGSPFGMLLRFADEMDRVFDDFGFGRAGAAPVVRDWAGSASMDTSRQGGASWLPDIEVLQRGNELVIRADLPGLRREDVKVEL